MNERHRVTGFDTFGAFCFQAVRVGSDDWVATRPDGWNLMFFTRQQLISHLADLVMEKRPGSSDQPGILSNPCIRLESSYRPELFANIDLAGNMWIGRDYLRPDLYLPMLVPEEEPHDHGGG